MLAVIAFLLIWIIIYGSLHAYFLWKVHTLFQQWNAFQIILVLFSFFMVFSPILINVLDRRGALHWAQPLAMIGYFWMGVILWLFFFGLLTDAWNGIIHAVSFFQPSARVMHLAPRYAIGGMLVATILACFVGMWNAGHIKLRVYRIPVASLAPGTKPIRLAQISDVHVGLIVRSGRIKKILRVVEDAKPDILVSTGDMTDASYHAMRGVTSLIAAVNPPLGKYATLGNHEHYAGLRNSITFLRECGFKVLENDSALAGQNLRLIGVDDPASRLDPESQHQKEIASLKDKSSNGRAEILLKHRPVVDPDSVGHFDLQLSGHSHGGQIMPFGLFVLLQYPIGPKLETYVEGRSRFYVTPGTGTWGPPMRMFASPEVALFILEPASSANSER